MPLSTPLTDTDLDRLDAFLLSDDAPENAMDISMLDGYLAAVASGPNLVMPDQWLRWVWDTEAGEETPMFKDQAEASEIVGLILQHYQAVNDSLNDRTYEPLILERKHKRRLVPIIDEWCMGYCIGIEADQEAWQPVLDAHPKLFEIIQLYGTEEGWAALEKKPLSDKRHDAAAESLADSAQLIHAYWLDQRRQGLNRGEMPGIMPSRGPIRAPVKVGRNEPCPCGSGKKFKHCHGGPDAGAPANDKQWLH